MTSQTDDHRLSNLMRKSQDGDSASYRELLKELIPIATRLVTRESSRLGSEAKEDIVQEILLAVHNKRHTYDPSRPFLPWLASIARFKAIDAFRRQKARPEVATEVDELERISETTIEEDLGEVDLESLLSDLPEKQRHILRLTKLEGLSIKETALKLGYTEADVKVSIHRAVKTLQRLRLERER